MSEVKKFIEGWEYLSTLPSGEAVIRLTGISARESARSSRMNQA
jgi:hypothetical protein